MSEDVVVVLTVDGSEHIADCSPETFERITADLRPEGTPNAITAIRRATSADLAAYAARVRRRPNPNADLRPPGATRAEWAARHSR